MLVSLVKRRPATWHHSLQLAVLSSQARELAVLAWGRNVEGQCGVEGDVPIVARPLPILELHGATVDSIHAGTLSSAAVLNQEVYTWGDGSSGKLGHGNGDSLSSPSRVESLVERSGISSAALGHHHSVLLGSDGAVWACGENKEGQCGLGLPLEVLASRYRKAFYESVHAPAAAAAALHGQQQLSNERFAQYLRAAVSSSASPAATAGEHVAQGWGSLSGISSSSSSSSRRSMQQQQQQVSQLFDMQRQRNRSAAAAGFDVQGGGSNSSSKVSSGLGGGLFGGSGGSSSTGSISSSGLWGTDLESLLRRSRLHAGQSGIPARVASEQSAAALGLRSGPSSNSSSSSSAVSDLEGRLEGQRVIGVSASKFFSLAVTDQGEVWAWGADYNGALGSESTWTSTPQQVAAPIADALAAAGGAVAVAAGGTFSAALTAAGTVLVWGKLGGGSPAAPGLSAAEAGVGSEPGSSSMFAQAKLPEGSRITSISAGQQHLLMTDGKRVWVIGRWLDSSGEEAGVASWDTPHEFDFVQLSDSDVAQSNGGQRSVEHWSTLSCSDGSGSRMQGGGEYIVKVVAGMHSSAAISNNGNLWLWGRLLDEQRGLSILRRFGGEKYAADIDWSWAGFGGAEPRLVDGLGAVKDVALGGWHAMVLVD